MSLPEWILVGIGAAFGLVVVINLIFKAISFLLREHPGDEEGLPLAERMGRAGRRRF